MAEYTCFNCTYCVCEPCLWLSLMRSGEPVLPRCANHPQWPGQLHEVPGVPCRRYRPRPVLPEGDNVRMIALTDGAYAYVDAADYKRLNRWKWHLDKGYPTRVDKGKVITMHRQIMRPRKGKVVDHFDGNRAHNCRANLRICTNAQNMRNRRKCSGSSSVYKGVFYEKRNHKWYARCCCMPKPVWRGFFDTEAEAARAYDRMAVELFGEFARVNFPREWPPERRAQVHADWQKRRKAEKAKARRKKARGVKRGATAGKKGNKIAQRRRRNEARDKRERAKGTSGKPRRARRGLRAQPNASSHHVAKNAKKKLRLR